MKIFTIFMLSYLTILLPSNLIVPGVKIGGCTAQKAKFSIKNFLGKCDLVTIREEILNGKIHFVSSDSSLF